MELLLNKPGSKDDRPSHKKDGAGDIMIDSKKQWFFLGLISAWIIITTVGPIVAFCVTRNPFSLSLISTLAPPLYVLYRITKSLFPLDNGDLQIALAKTEHKEKKQLAKPLHKSSIHLSDGVDKRSDTKT